MRKEAVTLKLRMVFTKKNQAKYIAHLDLTRVFDRALRRAGLQVAYSEGFNPHPRISFGAPLPVGVEGEHEYVDIELRKRAGEDTSEGKNREAYAREAVRLLQGQLPEGIEIADYCILPPRAKALMAVINMARYRVVVPLLEAVQDEKIQQAVSGWLQREEAVVRRAVKDKTVAKNIRPFVYRMEVLPENNKGKTDNFTAVFDIKMGNEGTVRPAEVLYSLGRLENIPVDLEGVHTVREGLYVISGSGEVLTPLEWDKF